MSKTCFAVIIIESERGWGNRVDEVLYFADVNKANKYVAKYNAKNNEPTVPDWYMYAREPILADLPKGAKVVK
jgi:hypothetical protein